MDCKELNNSYVTLNSTITAFLKSKSGSFQRCFFTKNGFALMIAENAKPKLDKNTLFINNKIK